MLIKTPIMDEIKITSVKSEMAEIGKNLKYIQRISLIFC